MRRILPPLSPVANLRMAPRRHFALRRQPGASGTSARSSCAAIHGFVGTHSATSTVRAPGSASPGRLPRGGMAKPVNASRMPWRRAGQRARRRMPRPGPSSAGLGEMKQGQALEALASLSFVSSLAGGRLPRSAASFGGNPPSVPTSGHCARKRDWGAVGGNGPSSPSESVARTSPSASRQARTTARPIPRAAPVTMMRLPSSLMAVAPPGLRSRFPCSLCVTPVDAAAVAAVAKARRLRTDGSGNLLRL